MLYDIALLIQTYPQLLVQQQRRHYEKPTLSLPLYHLEGLLNPSPLEKFVREKFAHETKWVLQTFSRQILACLSPLSLFSYVLLTTKMRQATCCT